MENNILPYRLVSLVLFFTLLIASFTTSAGTVVFDGPSSFTGAQVDVQLKGYNHGYSQRGSGGLMVFDRTGGDYSGSLLPDDAGSESLFSGFCLDWTSYIASGTTHNLETLSSSLGQDKADDISRLLYNVYPDFGTTMSSTKDALAIQIAIWEIVHEDQNNAYDVFSGDIRFTWDEFSTWMWWVDDARDVAQDMLDTWVTNNQYGEMLDNLAALTRDGAQNLLVQVNAVPIPGAVWLFGSALAGLVGLGRRRMMHS